MTEHEAWVTERRDQLWKCPNGRYAVQAGYILAGFGVHRDSDAAARANYETAQQLICEAAGQGWSGFGDLTVFHSDGDEIYTDALIVGSWGHWAVGWIEELLIRSDNAEVVAKAHDLYTYVTEQYPVLNDDLLSEIEWDDNHPDGDDRCYDTDNDCLCGREKA